MSNNNSHICRFCQSNMELAYYCEECGTSCCSDCLCEELFDYYVCQECDSKNIEILDGVKVCKQCNATNIIKTTKHLKSCPKCHSHQIINIYEKKEELEQKFLELIKETRGSIKPLRKISTKLNRLRHSLRAARDPPIKCYHYPKMESELLELFKHCIYTKNSLQEKIKIHFRHLSLNKEYFFDIYQQPNSNIRIIEGILENLERSFTSINEYVSNNLKNIDEKIEDLHKNVKAINNINDLFASNKHFLNLAEEEKPVYAIKTKLSNGLNTQDKFKKNKGILFITNFDLSFIHEFGLIKKNQSLIFKAPVDDLISIKERGRIFKKLYLEFSYGKYEFSFPSNLISNVIEYILLARNFDEIAIYDKDSANRLNILDFDLTEITSFIEAGINSFFSIKCQYNKSVNYKRITRSQDARGFNVAYHENRPSYYPREQPYQRSQNPIHAPIENSQDYYSQDIYDPYRIQNYEPNMLNYPHNNRNPPSSAFDDKNILMKKLERAHRFSPHSTNQHNSFHSKSINSSPSFNQDQHAFYSSQGFNKNHLSDLFDTNNISINNPHISELDSFEFDSNKEKHQKMLDLKRERYSLKQTLKKLDVRFDQGNISEVDYFRTYKNLQKEVYLIDDKIKAMQRKFPFNSNQNKYIS